MTKTIEIGAMLLGGISLFAVAFLGFALLSGVPLYEVAVIGNFFAPPEAQSGGETASVEAPTEGIERRTNDAVIEANMGILGAWTMPAPFTHEELTALADELKLKRTELAQREAAIAERESQVDDKLDVIAERFESLETLRAKLEEFELELSGRAAEVERDEQAGADRQTKKWTEVGRIFEGLEAAARNDFLLEYEPDEAAQILRAMDEDTAQDVLTGLVSSGVPAETKKAYVEAFSRAPAPTK